MQLSTKAHVGNQRSNVFGAWLRLVVVVPVLLAGLLLDRQPNSYTAQAKGIVPSMFLPTKSDSPALPQLQKIFIREFSKVNSFSFADPLNGWALVTTDSPLAAIQVERGLRVTHDGGRTWQPLAPAPSNTSRIAFTTSRDGWAYSTDPNELDFQTMWATHDGGLTWQAIPMEGVIGQVRTAGKTTWVFEYQCSTFASCDPFLHGIVRKTDDNGRTWQTLVTETSIGRLFALSPQVAWYTAYDPNNGLDPGHLVATYSGGQSWQSLPSACDDGVNLLAAISSQQLWALCDSLGGRRTTSQNVSMRRPMEDYTGNSYRIVSPWIVQTKLLSLAIRGECCTYGGSNGL